MTMHFSKSGCQISAASLVSAALLFGCSADDGDAKPEGSSGPVYGIVSVIFTDDGRTTYVNTFDTLDITSVSLDEAREYPGIPNFEGAEGKLFEMTDEAPTISRYEATTGEWTPEGTVSFQNYGVESASRAGNVFVDREKAYLSFDLTSRVVWDPNEMAIDGEEGAVTDIALDRNGLLLQQGAGEARTDGVYQSYYWSDADFFVHDPGSQIAIFDPDTGELRDVIDAPCPGLLYSQEDEDGNLYFSSGSSAAVPRLFDETAPEACLVRINAGEQVIDEDFTLTFSELTEGRQGASFLYIGDGKGLIQVFHDERVTIESDSDPFEVTASENWRLWLVDVNDRSAVPVDGLDYFAGAINGYSIDGRTFVILAAADYASSTVYEVFPDGTAVERFPVSSWAWKILRMN